MLRRYAAGSNAGSGGLAIGSSGIEAGGPLPLYPGDLRDVFDVRALLTDTKESFSFSLRLEFFESLRLNIPIVSSGSFTPDLGRGLKGDTSGEVERRGVRRIVQIREFTKRGN